MGNYIKGVHFEGPITGSNRAGGGLFDDIPLAHVDRFRGPYRCFFTDFTGVITMADMEASGWTETVIGTAGTRTAAYSTAGGFLVLNADTTADEGFNFQNNAALTTPVTAAQQNLSGPITSTPTLMDNRELIWATRVGFLRGAGAGAWTSKAIMGWFVTDASLMAPATGSMATGAATGGGIGFHFTEDGMLSTFSQATSAATINQVDTGYDMPTLATTMGAWVDLGFRARWTTAAAASGTANGYVEFYVNGKRVATHTSPITPGPLPMRSTQVYSTTYELINGPATADAVDMGIEYCFMAISRPGLTYPYTSGLNY